MPHPEIEALGKASKKGQTSAAISACIASEVRAGRDQQQAIAMCMGMAREKGASVPAPKGGS